MLVTMNGTHKGSEDGQIVKSYNFGTMYNIADSLAAEFIRLGKASPAAPNLDQILYAIKILGQASRGAPIDSLAPIFSSHDLTSVANFLGQIGEILANHTQPEAPSNQDTFMAILNQDTAISVSGGNV